MFAVSSVDLFGGAVLGLIGLVGWVLDLRRDRLRGGR